MLVLINDTDMRFYRYFPSELTHEELAAKIGFNPRYFSERLSRGKLPVELKIHRVKHGNQWFYDWNKCRPLLIDHLV